MSQPQRVLHERVPHLQGQGVSSRALFLLYKCRGSGERRIRPVVGIRQAWGRPGEVGRFRRRALDAGRVREETGTNFRMLLFIIFQAGIFCA